MPRGKPSVQVTATCKTCKWFEDRNGSTFGVCMPDLPPMVMRSADPKKYHVNHNYTCALHQVKPGVT